MTTTKPQWIKRRWEPRELVLIGVLCRCRQTLESFDRTRGRRDESHFASGKEFGLYDPHDRAAHQGSEALDAHALYRCEHARKRPAFGRKSDASSRCGLGRRFGELFVVLSGGVHKPWAPWVAVGVYDFVSKMLSPRGVLSLPARDPGTDDDHHPDRAARLCGLCDWSLVWMENCRGAPPCGFCSLKTRAQCCGGLTPKQNSRSC